MRIKKFLLLAHSFLLVFLMAAVFKPSVFYWLLIPVNSILFIISYRIINLKPDRSFLKYLILPILFVDSCFFYGSLLPSRLLFALLLFFSVMLLYYYYRSAVKYCFIESDRRKNLPFWSNLFGFLTVFLASSFIYGLPYFINIHNWLLLLILASVLFVSFFHNLSVEKKIIQTDLFFSFFFLFSVFPLLWSLLLMPFNYNILGLIVSLFYYSGLNFTIFYLNKELTVKKIRYNLIFIGLFLLLILLGAKWK
jgi:hypothetical protein